MANVNTPNGFSPVRTSNGNPWNQQATLYWIPSTDGSQYNIGDPVKSVAGSSPAGGNPQLGDTIGGIAAIAKAASGDTLRGVIVGFMADPNSLQIINVPATKTHDYYAFVVDDPEVIFECTDDGVTSANLVSTAVGKNADMTVANPTAPSPVSATVLTSSTFSTTQARVWKILGLKQTPGNVAAAFARWIVRINQHELMGNTAGV